MNAITTISRPFAKVLLRPNVHGNSKTIVTIDAIRRMINAQVDSKPITENPKK